MPNCKTIAALTAVLYLSACAGANYRPLVDTSRSPANYEQDLAECQRYAQGEADAMTGAAIGAGLGALLGIVTMVAAGGKGRWGAAPGAIGGALGAGSAANNNQQSVIANCMSGRGYSVLR